MCLHFFSFISVPSVVNPLLLGFSSPGAPSSFFEGGSWVLLSLLGGRSFSSDIECCNNNWALAPEDSDVASS